MNVKKPKSEQPSRVGGRPSEDDLARADLGGPRGDRRLEPAKMTPQRRKKTPEKYDPGHTA